MKSCNQSMWLLLLWYSCFSNLPELSVSFQHFTVNSKNSLSAYFQPECVFVLVCVWADWRSVFDMVSWLARILTRLFVFFVYGHLVQAAAHGSSAARCLDRIPALSRPLRVSATARFTNATCQYTVDKSQVMFNSRPVWDFLQIRL